MTTHARPGPGPTRLSGWIVIGAVAVLAVIALAGFAVSFAGHGTPVATTPGSQDPPPHAGFSPLPSPGASGSSSPGTGSGAHSSPKPGKPGGTTAPAPTSQPPGSGPTSPPAPPDPSPTTAPTQIPILFVPSVSVSTNDEQTGTISFSVTDVGFVSTDEIAVTITLPSGISVSGFGGGGWTCTAGGSAVSCQHSPIGAFSQASGAVSVTISDTAACGQNVQMTAVTSADSASASASVGC